MQDWSEARRPSASYRCRVNPLLEEYAARYRLRRLQRVGTERRTLPKSRAHIEPHRCELACSRLQTQHGKSGAAYFLFDARENGVGNALAARGVVHIHALDLGVFREEGDAAAAYRSPLASCE